MKFRAFNPNRIEKKVSNNNLGFYLKRLEKQNQNKPKSSKRQEIIKIRAAINEFENKKIMKINETKKNWFFEIINKIEKPLATQRERKQINIRNERENVIADLKDIKRIIEYQD